MFRKRFFSFLMAMTLAFGCAVGALAVEVESGDVYCFSSGDFSQSEEEPLVGVCILELPDAGAVLLGQRVVRPGDILTAGQLEDLTFQPAPTETDTAAQVSYLPIYENRVEPEAVLTFSIRGREDKAPVAEDFSLETYKNIPNEGALKVKDPEGQAMTYTLVRQPRRGTVEIREDGSFVYTPKKNKVGVDSFTFTATDPAGKVSREATVTVRILKPQEAAQYTDTVGADCRFSAEWLKNTGLFVGEQVGGNACFYPEKTVSRGEFLAMAVKVLDIPLTSTDEAGLPANAPQWLKPYLAAAQRSGLMASLETNVDYQGAITGAEAAVILQNALDLTVSSETLQTEKSESAEDIPSWAAASLTVMAENGVALNAGSELTRADAAKTLYQVSKLAPEAPGMAVFRMQQ